MNNFDINGSIVIDLTDAQHAIDHVQELLISLIGYDMVKTKAMYREWVIASIEDVMGVYNGESLTEPDTDCSEALNMMCNEQFLELQHCLFNYIQYVAIGGSYRFTFVTDSYLILTRLLAP